MRKVLCVFLLPAFAWSQNLHELVELSIKNRLVESSSSTIESIKKDYDSVKSSYLPQVNLGAKYARAKNETASTPNTAYNAYASVDYVLYDGGKKQDVYDSYESNIKSFEQSHESLKNQIALDVVKYYFNYQSLMSSQESKLKEIEQLKSQYERLESFYSVGNATQDELQKIVSRVEIANVDLSEIKLNIVDVLHKLEYITGQKVDITQGSYLTNTKDIGDIELRNDIKALQYDLKTLKSNAKAQKSEELPKITLNNTFTYYENQYDNALYDVQDDNQNILSANLVWNVFSSGQTQSNYEAKYKEYLSLKSKYEYEKNKASIDLQLAQRAYSISTMKIESAKLSLKAANSTYDIVKSQYENGIVDNVAFLESLSEKYNALSTLEKAKNDLQIKKAEIVYYSGKNLIGYINENN